MSIRLFTLRGYAHLYRSLLRFCDLRSREARELVYTLNTANLDSFRCVHPDGHTCESGYVAFMNSMERLNLRPYRTEVQLHKALAALKRNILPDALTSGQGEAVARLSYLMRSLELSFYKAYGMEIDDRLTVYADCAANLVPRDGEPAVCIMLDWALLPTS